MTQFPSAHYRRILEIMVFIFTFIAASLAAHRYESLLTALLSTNGFLSELLFVVLTAVFVVFVIPLDIVFLIPIGAHTWGPVATALMSILGWVIGASLAFWIARTKGMSMVAYLVGDEKVRALKERIPHTDLFWSVLFLRMLIPVDLLSYALGLFTAMPWRSYVVATAIGVSPFGFFFAYAGTLPPWYQAVALMAAFILVTGLLWRYGRSRVSDGGQSHIDQE